MKKSKNIKSENFFVKPVPTLFYKLGDKSLKAYDILMVLEAIEENEEVKDYGIDSLVAGMLVTEKIVNKRIGSRMATLYSPGERFREFSKTFKEEYYYIIENNKDMG